MPPDPFHQATRLRIRILQNPWCFSLDATIGALFWYLSETQPKPATN